MATFTASTRSSAVLRSTRQQVWETLTDAELIARLTPYVTGIEVDGDRWVWTMRTLPVLSATITPRFTEIMEFTEGERIDFSHDPAQDQESVAVTGSYLLADHGDGGTEVSIDLEISCRLPLPGLARPAVNQVMAGVVRHMGAVFSRNLLRHLGEN